jgi:hypothetical protein
VKGKLAMKKKISYLLMVVLIACSLIMPCVADEPTTDLVTEITTELVTDALEETTPEEVTTPEATEPEAPAEDVTEDAELTAELEQIKEMVEKLSKAEDISEVKELISSASTWVIIGSGIIIILAVCGIVKKKFGVIIDVVNVIRGFFGKDKNENGEPVTLSGELKDVKDEIVKEVKKVTVTEYSEVAKTLELYRKELKNKEDNEQRMYAILTLFMTNCKISESAKAEILNILADVKKYSGDVSEFVAQAQEAIENAKEEAPQTPTLDQMLEEDYMDLG